jgi:hypothetical protein
MPDWSKCTHVYVAHGPLGHKVGIAGNVASRLRFVEYEACGPVALVHSWHRPADARLVEYNAHHILHEHLSSGLEWFAVSEQEALAAVETAIARIDAGAHVVPPPHRRRQPLMERDCSEAWKHWHEEAEAWLKTAEGKAHLEALEASSE